MQRRSKVREMAIHPFPFQVLCQALALLIAKLICVVAFLALCGCSKRYDDMPAYWPVAMGDYDNESVGRFKTSYLASQIDNYYRGTNPGPIGVTTFVNVDDLYSTSTFGRMLAEQLMSELAMSGYDVIELRHADALQLMDARGEFALSRDPTFVRTSRELGGVVVGTYVVSPVRVYLNARLIDPATSRVLSAGSVEMSKTKEISKMLRGGTFGAALERIPVRHIGFSTYPMTIAQPSRRVYDLSEMEGSYAPSIPQVKVPAPQFMPENKKMDGK
jgi:TolB-like protein